MPEIVKIFEEQRLIKVDSFGKTTINDWNTSMKQILDIHSDTGYSSVLVDVRKQEISPNMMDIFEFGNNLPRKLKFAVVVSEINLEDQAFLETVGKNRGKLIQIFSNEEDAFKWLKVNSVV